MNKLTRTLTMGGFGLLAALAGGAGPAQAATNNGASVAKPAPHHAQLREDVQIAGYYQTQQGCELAGQFGERSDDWDFYDCTPVRLGVRSGAWALQVASYDDWGQRGFGVPLRNIGGFPHRFRPSWPGQFGPGHPGRGFDDRGPRGFDNRGPRGFDRGPVGLGPSGIGSAAPVGAGAPTHTGPGTPTHTGPGMPTHTGTGTPAPVGAGIPSHTGVAPTGHQGH
jgi:hypothetical protein